ncbi:hypothetical protein QBC44DRAFT_228324 [Cladorrhinum sp. PSN332]|nr:hypothetical protein QBC44DRAFT_228324 [Cladorrhinum sp. PSN332]
MEFQSGSDFAWTNCQDKESHTRVCLKQQAVDDAFACSQKLCDELSAVLNQVGPEHPTTYFVLGGNEIEAWMKELGELKETNNQLEILVGVAGATGVGKTSLLNALLESPELLPSSSQQASTATVCRVAYNHDDTEGHDFKAEVAFRRRDDVIGELLEVLNAIEERKRLYREHFEDEKQRCEAIEEVTATIAKGISQVCAVWDLDEGDLEDSQLTVESVLKRNLAAVEKLGTTITIHSADAREFALEIQPYLDTTPTQDGMTAWPLIKEVRIFLKAEILKRGIVLVDLPGLLDSSDGRSRVAEDYFQKLDLTTIVAPAIRAADEKTAVDLMNSHQETRMQLDGRYHKGSFCVVISKINDINCDTICTTSGEAQKDAKLQADLQQIQSIEAEYRSAEMDLNSVEKEMRSLSKKADKLKRRLDKIKERKGRGKGNYGSRFDKLRAKRSKYVSRRTQLKHQKKKIDGRFVEYSRSLQTLVSRRMHRCVWLRNAYIKKRIQADFTKRQKKLRSRAAITQGSGRMNDGAIEVFPVCAAAFRDLLEENKRPQPGFPSKAYTGIPRLRQWLDEATLGHREAHLDSILLTLQRLFKAIERWSESNNTGLIAAKDIQHIKPIRKKNDKLGSCEAMAVQCTSRWACKEPENMNSVTKMNWATFQAVLKKDGGPHRSTAAGRPVYDFPQSLATPFLISIADDWLRFFHTELPQQEGPMVEKMTSIWRQYMNEVRDQIRGTAPQIFPYFADTSLAMERVVLEMHSKIMIAIQKLSRAASQIHPLFVDVLRRELAPIFKRALDITGKGQFKRRQDFLLSEVQAKCRDIYGTGCARMEQDFTSRVNELPRGLDGITKFVVSAVKLEIGLTLNNLQAVDRREHTDTLNMKLRLQRSVKALTLVSENLCVFFLAKSLGLLCVGARL